MKFTLSWLKKHLDTTAAVDEIAATLNRIGLEVEHIEDPAKKLAGFIVAEVRAAEQHPNADRLKVCKVWDGKTELNIVCGAPNARAGIKVVLAPVGVIIPQSGQPLKLGKIRGEESQGMMCSYPELQIDGENLGIIELPADAKVGAPAAGALGAGEPVIEIAVTPNRSDCAGILGIARDLAAAGIGKFKELPKIKIKESGKSNIAVTREVDAKLCPVFATRLIKGVKNGPSPEWLQQELRAVGLRPISALVDITNYFCMDRARPLHVFDADKISGGLAVRHAKNGEKLEALNDKTYELNDSMVVIADANGVQSLAGIMGGVPTSCTESTVNVLLEAALWDPTNVARTGRALQINSDARYRFERGVDPAAVISGLDAAAQMIVELCGGEVSPLNVVGEEPKTDRTYILRPDRVAALGGLELSIAKQAKILIDLGFAVKEKNKLLEVTPPSWRADIMGEADLVEEILRIHGFDHIPAVSIRVEQTVPNAGVNDNQRRVLRARRALAAQGLFESITWSFVKEKEAIAFGGGSAALKLTNPISTDMSDMRPTPLPGLLAALANNFARSIVPTGLFEIGPAFFGPQPDQQKTISAWVRSAQPERHWQGMQSADAMTVKADVMAVLTALGQNADLPVTPDVPGYYHPGRSGAMMVGKNAIAYFGELHPEVAAMYDFKIAPMMAEIILDNLPPARKKGSAKPMLEASSFQPVERDFAFVVPRALPAADLIKAVKLADRNLIADVQIFDVYMGKGIEEDKKSVALSVTLQPREKTLTDAEIETISQAIIKAAEKIGAKIR